MKRFSVLVCFCVLNLCALAQSYLTLDEAKQIVDNYYRSMKQMSVMPYSDEGADAKLRVVNLIGVDNNGWDMATTFRVPNDIGKIYGTSTANDCQVGKYCEDFRKFANKNNFGFSYKLVNTEYVTGPQVKGSKSFPDFVRVVVKKDFIVKGQQPISFHDSVFLSTRTKSFAAVYNQYRRSVKENEKYMTIEELLAVAEDKYSNKRYDEAYRLYRKVLERSPMNEAASYKLGVMSFKGEGCKQYPRKVRDYLAVFYWQKSEKGLDELGRLNNNLPERITSFSGLESNPFPSNRLLAYDRNKNRLGYISAQGKMAVEQQYKYAYPFFENGTALVKSEKDEWFLIDTTGKVKDVYLDHNIPKSGQQLVVHKMGKSGVVNRKTGEWEVPFDYQITGWDWEIIGRGAGVLHYYVTKNGKRGLISSKNDMIVPAIYDNLRSVDYKEDKITLLCNYDLTAYNQLLKRYERADKIPVDELEEIGTIVKLNLPSFTNGVELIEVHKSGRKEWQLMDATGKVVDVFESVFGLGFQNHDILFLEFKKDGKYGLLWPDYRILLPAISKDVIMPLYDSGENWVSFIYDRKEPAYGRLVKKYGNVDKIPEKELKKVATILKVDLK